jgi:hypothetical protein
MLDAIQRLHPDWLRVVGGPTSTRQAAVVGVFIDGDMRGYTVDKLADYSPDEIKLVRRISPTESVGTYGASWRWGGVVLTRSR